MKTKLPEISRSEYAILQILWKEKQLSVREVHDCVHEQQGWAYTTTKTMMDRMAQKGLLHRENFHGVFLYRALISRPLGLARFVQFFADQVLEMETTAVLALFANNPHLTAAETAELEKLLEQKESADKK
jgi:BlaI family transcriptional regulator, penicillinase repressor